MKNVKKVTAMLLSLVMLVCCLSMSASAVILLDGTKVTRRINAESRFSGGSWEHTRVYTVNGSEIGHMAYGYDTAWINEDFAWVMSEECLMQAGIQKIDNGVELEPDFVDAANPGNYSKYEVRHTVDDVRYIGVFAVTYSNIVAYTNENTNEKIS